MDLFYQCFDIGFDFVIVLFELLLLIILGTGVYFSYYDSKGGAVLGFPFAIKFELNTLFLFLCIAAKVFDNGAAFFIWHQSLRTKDPTMLFKQ